TGDPSQEYFVAGMHDALIGELGQISALRVISRTSTLSYKGPGKSIPEIAGELDVDVLIEGSVSKAGENVRVQVRVIRARPEERQVFSHTYEGDLRNVLSLQKQVARAIAEEIQVRITPQEAKRLAAARPVNPAAFDAWSQGWYQYRLTTTDSLYECIDHAATA